MDLLEAIRTRRSTHYFEPGRRIPRETLEQLFELTQLAPSSWNLQPWRYLVIEDQETRQKIRGAAWDQRHITECSAIVLVCADPDPEAYIDEILANWVSNEYIPEEMGESWRQLIPQFYGTPELRCEYAVRNSSFGAMTLMLAAHGLGLATCPMIGFDKAAVAETVGGLPDGYVISFMMALGYPGQPEKPRQQRLGHDRVVFYESFSPALE